MADVFSIGVMAALGCGIFLQISATCAATRVSAMQNLLYEADIRRRIKANPEQGGGVDDVVRWS